MRLIAETQTRASAAHSTEWGHKLRGRIYRALDGTAYESRHDSNEPSGFVTSCPIPFGDVHEGEHRTIMIASPEEDMLDCIDDDLHENPRLTVGEWDLDVLDTRIVGTDPGEPGTRGVISTVTGILVSIPNHRLDSYGIEIDDAHRDTRTFWRPKFGNGPFVTQLTNNLDRKHRLYQADHLPGPCDVQGRLFDSKGLIKQFATPLTVAQGVEQTVVMTKWHFGYTVRDQDHRRHLALALDCGLGERNSLGLGFMNRLPPAHAASVLGIDVTEQEASEGDEAGMVAVDGGSVNGQ